MALSYETYTGNGAITTFSVPFPYIDRAHVAVAVDGVNTAFTWDNATQVRVTPAPVNGTVVRVARSTPNTTRLVDWSDGTVLKEADLDLADTQALFIVQEAFDASSEAVRLNLLGQFDALNKRIVNVATPTAGGDAVNKNYADAIVVSVAASASSASTSASTATTAANTATTAAATATTAANTATAAAATLPVATAPNADKWLRINGAGTGWSYRTSAEVLTDIGAQAALGFTPANVARTITAGAGLSGGGSLAADRTLTVDNTVVAFLAGVQAFTGAKRYTPVTLTDAATIAWDLDAAPLSRVTLGGNRTVGAPTNQRDGGMFILIVNQDGTGGRTLAWNAAFDFGTEGTPSLPTGASKVSIFTFISNGTTMRCIGRWSN